MGKKVRTGTKLLKYTSLGLKYTSLGKSRLSLPNAALPRLSFSISRNNEVMRDLNSPQKPRPTIEKLSKPRPTKEKLSSQDFYKICRLCATSNGPMSPILLWMPLHGLPAKISICTSIVVSPTDQLPKQICSECNGMISRIVTFRKSCLSTNIQLENILSSDQQEHSQPLSNCSTVLSENKRVADLEPHSSVENPRSLGRAAATLRQKVNEFTEVNRQNKSKQNESKQNISKQKQKMTLRKLYETLYTPLMSKVVNRPAQVETTSDTNTLSSNHSIVNRPARVETTSDTNTLSSNQSIVNRPARVETTSDTNTLSSNQSIDNRPARVETTSDTNTLSSNQSIVNRPARVETTSDTNTLASNQSIVNRPAWVVTTSDTNTSESSYCPPLHFHNSEETEYEETDNTAMEVDPLKLEFDCKQEPCEEHSSIQDDVNETDSQTSNACLSDWLDIFRPENQQRLQTGAITQNANSGTTVVKRSDSHSRNVIQDSLSKQEFLDLSCPPIFFQDSGQTKYEDMDETPEVDPLSTDVPSKLGDPSTMVFKRDVDICHPLQDQLTSRVQPISIKVERGIFTDNLPRASTPSSCPLDVTPAIVGSSKNQSHHTNVENVLYLPLSLEENARLINMENNGTLPLPNVNSGINSLCHRGPSPVHSFVSNEEVSCEIANTKYNEVEIMESRAASSKTVHLAYNQNSEIDLDEMEIKLELTIENQDLTTETCTVPVDAMCLNSDSDSGSRGIDKTMPKEINKSKTNVIRTSEKNISDEACTVVPRSMVKIIKTSWDQSATKILKQNKERSISSGFAFQTRGKKHADDGLTVVPLNISSANGDCNTKSIQGSQKKNDDSNQKHSRYTVQTIGKNIDIDTRCRVVISSGIGDFSIGNTVQPVSKFYPSKLKTNVNNNNAKRLGKQNSKDPLEERPIEELTLCFNSSAHSFDISESLRKEEKLNNLGLGIGTRSKPKHALEEDPVDKPTVCFDSADNSGIAASASKKKKLSTGNLNVSNSRNQHGLQKPLHRNSKDSSHRASISNPNSPKSVTISILDDELLASIDRHNLNSESTKAVLGVPLADFYCRVCVPKPWIGGGTCKNCCQVLNIAGEGQHHSCTSYIRERKPKSQEYKGHQCNICLEMVHSTLALNRHLKDHEIGIVRKISCCYCEVKCNSKRLLQLHIISQHENELMLKCELCKVPHKTVGNLLIHMREQHAMVEYEEKNNHKGSQHSSGEFQLTFKSIEKDSEKIIIFELINPIFKCRVCTEMFITHRELMMHLEALTQMEHHDSSHSECVKLNKRCEIRHICSFCDKIFNNDQLLSYHVSLNHMGPYICVLCTTHFKSKYCLEYHILSEHKNDALKCKICERVSSSLADLCIHMEKKHTQKAQKKPRERSLECDTCSKMFCYKFQLVKHMRVHTGETPYKCQYCPREFTLDSNRTMHMRLHTGEKRYVCCECGKAFTHNVSKKNHIAKCHSEQMEQRSSFKAGKKRKTNKKTRGKGDEFKIEENSRKKSLRSASKIQSKR